MGLGWVGSGLGWVWVGLGRVGLGLGVNSYADSPARAPLAKVTASSAWGRRLLLTMWARRLLLNHVRFGTTFRGRNMYVGTKQL